jgi:L-rhamnose mutarotase
MKQYGRTLNLRNDPEVIESYIEQHRAIWPEVERGLKSKGIQRMLIWILGRQLFMFMETADEFDPDRDWARYEASHPRIRE